MRTGPRIIATFVVLFAGASSPALAADSLTVFVDNNEIALGGVTAIAAHAETSAGFGGGHVAFKYKGADVDCGGSPAADEGTDAVAADRSNPVPAGEGAADVGGQTIQLDVGNWRICGWLVDDTTGVVAAQGTTVVRVLPYAGSLGISLTRSASLVQVNLTWATSAPARFYASLQRAAKACPRSPARMPKGSIALVPRGGRFVGSDGGLGRAVNTRRLSVGRWRVCVWLRADVGSVGPASRTFAVRRRPRRGGNAAG
jgi:hypothetical protein